MFAALCDDDKYIIEELKKLLLTYAKKNRIIIDIDEFESGEKLLNSENNYDIIVLDFQLGSTDGLTVAKELRRRNVLSCIIFLTSYFTRTRQKDNVNILFLVFFRIDIFYLFHRSIIMFNFTYRVKLSKLCRL